MKGKVNWSLSILCILFTSHLLAAPPYPPTLAPIEVGKFDRDMKEFREQVPEDMYKKVTRFKKIDRELGLEYYRVYKDYLMQVCSSENNIQKDVTEFAGMDLTKPYSPKLLKCNNKAQVSFVDFVNNYEKHYKDQKDGKRIFALPVNESMASECKRTKRAEIICPEGEYKFVVKESIDAGKIDLGVDDRGRILHKKALPLPGADELKQIRDTADR